MLTPRPPPPGAGGGSSPPPPPRAGGRGGWFPPPPRAPRAPRPPPRPPPPRPRQPAPALLLQPLRPLSLPDLVARRHGADPGLQQGPHLGLGRVMAHGSAAGRADAGDPDRGNHLEGPPRLVPRRPARGLQQLPRRAAEPALAHHRRRRRSLRAHLLRMR